MPDKQKRVLIVEDNAEWRELLSIIVRKLGHEVVAARTGKEGLQRASESHPDLIFMDIGLPEMSGDEATVRIKADPATKHIPVVIQTAFGAGSAANRALAAGAAEMMLKPIEVKDIHKVLSKYLTASPAIDNFHPSPLADRPQQ